MIMKVSFHNRQVNTYHGVMAEMSEAGTERTILTLTGPRALRAIAHEARQQVIDELYSGSVLTATEAAQMCGLSPSAMSYHLRALEKWGIVVRDEASTDGRERPWRAGAHHLQIGRGDWASGTSMRQAANAVISTVMAGLNNGVDAWLENDPTAKGASLSRGRLYLTDDEAAALNSDLDALVRRYDAGRTSRNKPADASPRDHYWLLFPHVSQRGR